MSKAFLEEIDQLVRARYGLIYVMTWEEERCRGLIGQVAARQQKSLFEWSITDGLRRITSTREAPDTSKRTREPLSVLNEILQANTQALYILKDFHNYIETPEIVRQLRDLSHSLRHTKKNIIFISPQLTLPEDLEKSITIVDLPLPSYEDISSLLSNSIEGGARHFRVNLSDPERDAMVKAALGLTFAEAENAFAKAIVRHGILDGSDLEVIASEKKQIIRKSDILECYDVDDTLEGVGGMDLLKDWLRKRLRAFSQEARQYGLPQPKGILLMGTQGCGKSLVAKSIAAAWKLPLLRMDMSRIFQSYIGSSEQNMRKAMSIAEGIAPVVLWIDEIEKAFSGSDASSTADGGTTARVLGSFLTWLQEKKAPVFVVATANEVRGLPPELLRKGRLDEIFFVDLPTMNERTEILGIHLRKMKRDPANFNIPEITKATEGFSGAEIEQMIISAMHDSFFENRKLQSEDLLKTAQESVPLSTTMQEKIAALRQWSTNRARPVSSTQRDVGRITP